MVKSKLAKTRILMNNRNIAKYIPDTRKLTDTSLSSMLLAHRMVYVKPDLGMGGVGVIRVEQIAPSVYKLQHGTRIKHYPSLRQLYESVTRIQGTRKYLVQQGIPLLRHNGAPFDIRVMVQKNPAGIWEATGIIGRVAHPSRIVTNYHSGGTPIGYHSLMKQYLNREDRMRLLDQLRKLGLEVARYLEKRYPGIKEVGLDVGLDSGYSPWLIEVNTLPNPFIFKKLKDQSIYRKIARYAAAYGRFQDRYCPEMAGRRQK
jgi:glutathione synthase/RimK-type ligase-like ATP-grasp enzyme